MHALQLIRLPDLRVFLESAKALTHILVGVLLLRLLLSELLSELLRLLLLLLLLLILRWSRTGRSDGVEATASRRRILECGREPVLRGESVDGCLSWVRRHCAV